MTAIDIEKTYATVEDMVCPRWSGIDSNLGWVAGQEEDQVT